jgi:hAT family C-terminal dimerisation region
MSRYQSIIWKFCLWTGIDQVFWVYETLFNELDCLSTIAQHKSNAHHIWLTALAPALLALTAKLRKYYKKTSNVVVYPNGVIFQPRGKLSLFKQYSWDEEWIAKYSDACRERYVREYKGKDITPSHSSTKRTFAQFNKDDDNEYEEFLSSLNPTATTNEYDRYIQAPLINFKIQVLNWWRANGHQYPQLSRMVRDTLAVPATRAGVERAFSLSGRVVTVIRSQLSPETISDIMMYSRRHIN